MTKDGVSIATPTWLTFNSNQFSFIITAVADIGTYTVTTTSEIPQVDPGTGVNRIITSTFYIVVVSDYYRYITENAKGNQLEAVKKNALKAYNEINLTNSHLATPSSFDLPLTSRSSITR